MKTIMMSIHPKWVEKIISGEKTIEVRKTAPKEVPFKVYIYCTKQRFPNKKYLYINETSLRSEYGVCDDWLKYDTDTLNINEGTPYQYETYFANGKIIGEFICNAVESIPVDSEAFTAISKPSCLTTDEMIEYCSGRDMYGLHISALKIYDKPRELGEFRKPDTSCGFYNPDLERCDSGYNCERCVYNDLTITRPPQSWQYVGEVEE